MHAQCHAQAVHVGRRTACAQRVVRVERTYRRLQLGGQLAAQRQLSMQWLIRPIREWMSWRGSIVEEHEEQWPFPCSL